MIGCNSLLFYWKKHQPVTPGNYELRKGSTRDYFFIPLFLPGGIKENIKDYSKFNFEPFSQYAFGRLIETDKSGGDLIEVFRYTGKIPANPAIIITSGLLFHHLHVSMSFSKKRGKFTFDNSDYDPVTDSSYNEISFVLGDDDDPILWKGGKQESLDKAEAAKYN